MFFTTKVQYDLQLWFITTGDKKKKKKMRRDAPERKDRGFVYKAFPPSQFENQPWRLQRTVLYTPFCKTEKTLFAGKFYDRGREIK